MQILVLSNCPLVESQGSGYVIVNTVKSLTDLGHKVDLIPPTEMLILTSWQGRFKNYRMAIGMARWVFKNRKNIKNYQLIIFYGAESAVALFFLKVIFRIKIPIVLHSNGIELHSDYRLKSFKDELPHTKKWYNNLQNYIFKYCYKNIDAIITVSKYDKNYLLDQLKIPSDKVYYNEPSLPEVFFEFTGELQSKKQILTYCGSWIPLKGIGSIKNALPDILRMHPGYKLRLIGVGDGFKKEDNFPGDILDKIEIYPTVKSKKQLMELYSESQIFLFPSFSDSFGIVVAEAMFCNCAIICGPTGIGESLINNEEAKVLKLPDVSSVYMALEELITNPALREKLSNNGKKRTEQLNWRNYTTKLGQIIDAIINKNQL